MAALLMMMLTGTALLSAGCGGGGSTSEPQSAAAAVTTDDMTAAALPGNSGGARLLIVWPQEDTRLIPSASRSVKLAVTRSGKLVPGSERLAVRSFTPVEVVWDKLPLGVVTISATAFPNDDGSGTAQAGGTVAVEVLRNQTVPVTITMASAISRVAITPTNILELLKGESADFAATAYDAAGNVVLTNSAWDWKCSNTNAASVTPNPAIPAAATLKGISFGPVTLTATEVESGRSSQSAPIIIQAYAARELPAVNMAVFFAVEPPPVYGWGAKEDMIPYIASGFEDSGWVIGKTLYPPPGMGSGIHFWWSALYNINDGTIRQLRPPQAEYTTGYNANRPVMVRGDYVAGYNLQPPGGGEAWVYRISDDTVTPVYLEPGNPQSRGIIADINNAGLLIGRARSADSTVFHRGVTLKLGSGNAPQPLLPLDGANPRALNDNGIIVGSSGVESAPGTRAVLWQGPGSAPEDLGIDLPSQESSIALDVNNQGDVVGESIVRENGQARSLAFLWQRNVGVTPLVPLGGMDSSHVVMITQDGWILGESRNEGSSGGEPVPTLWSARDGRPRDLRAMLMQAAPEPLQLVGMNSKRQILAHGALRTIDSVGRMTAKLYILSPVGGIGTSDAEPTIR